MIYSKEDRMATNKETIQGAPRSQCGKTLQYKRKKRTFTVDRSFFAVCEMRELCVDPLGQPGQENVEIKDDIGLDGRVFRDGVPQNVHEIAIDHLRSRVRFQHDQPEILVLGEIFDNWLPSRREADRVIFPKQP